MMFVVVQFWASLTKCFWLVKCYEGDDECRLMMHTPDNMPVYYGSQWVILSREFCEYLTNTSEPFVASWVKFFKSRKQPLPGLIEESNNQQSIY